MPAYVVFTDLTLQAIAEVRPADGPGLLRINGIGAAKLTKYGDDVLALVAGEEVADEPGDDPLPDPSDAPDAEAEDG